MKKMSGPKGKDLKMSKACPRLQEFIGKFMSAYALFGKVLHEETAMFSDGKADEQFKIWVPKIDQEAFNAKCRAVLETEASGRTGAAFGCYLMMRLGRLNDPYLNYSMASEFEIDNDEKRLLWGINRNPDRNRVFVPLLVTWMNKRDHEQMKTSLKALSSIPGMMMQTYFNGMWKALLSGEILIKPESIQTLKFKEDEYEKVGEWCRLVPEKFKTLGNTEIHPLISIAS